MAVVLTPVQTKQIRINIHKRNNTKRSTNNTKHSVRDAPVILLVMVGFRENWEGYSSVMRVNETRLVLRVL